MKIMRIGIFSRGTGCWCNRGYPGTFCLPRFFFLSGLLMLGVLFLVFFAIGNTQFVFAGNAYIKVIYPNGGEDLENGSNVIIRWQSQEVKGKMVIVLYKSGIKHGDIACQAPNSGQFLWKIPGDIPIGKDYRIRIRALQDVAVNDFSDGDFSIIVVPGKNGKTQNNF